MQHLFSAITEPLLTWYGEHKRDLPWRRDREPYHIWLSEIMLQQTRVEAVKGYYSRFLSALPTVEALAEAPEELCHKLWEGLGYYSRVRNLQKAAQVICRDYGGCFPRDYTAICALPGIGDYTAGAIASICFEAPTPAVDGNVVRVLTRLTKDDRAFTDPALRRELKTQLEAVYPIGACGDFTQSLMELGATVCTPNGTPHCHNCPLSHLCLAFRDGTQLKYPVRAEKKPRRKEKRTVLIFSCGDRVALRKRPDKGLLAGLWEYPNVLGQLTMEQALQKAEDWCVKPVNPVKIVEKQHVFTHVEWQLTGIYIMCSSMPDGFVWATAAEIEEEYALPTAFRQFADPVKEKQH